eukprot:g26195.t1
MAWYGNCSSQDPKKLQKVMCIAQTITEANLPSMDSIYTACCHLVQLPLLVVQVLGPSLIGRNWLSEIQLRILMDKDESGPKGRVLNWVKANYSRIRQELGNVDWEQQFE